MAAAAATACMLGTAKANKIPLQAFLCCLALIFISHQKKKKKMQKGKKKKGAARKEKQGLTKGREKRAEYK